MADKEEKVAIVKSPCYIHNKKTVFKNCMTRSEAIVKMAKAFCELGAPNTWYEVEEGYRNYCLAAAEAALNALLEAHK